MANFWVVSFPPRAAIYATIAKVAFGLTPAISFPYTRVSGFDAPRHHLLPLELIRLVFMTDEALAETVYLRRRDRHD
jgi:hypothetical protein